MKTIVVGIDPAPGKGATLAHAELVGSKVTNAVLEPKPLCAPALRERLRAWRGTGHRLLVCWDAPLTGPTHLDDQAGQATGDFTIRPIERILRSKDWKVPGVSVQGYAGCTHWTVSRNVLGYPRVGRFDTPELDFDLLTSEHDQPGQHSVIEVHPAVALLFWLAPTEKALQERRTVGLCYKWTKDKDQMRKKTVASCWRSCAKRGAPRSLRRSRTLKT